jgi:hypothetical protein
MDCKDYNVLILGNFESVHVIQFVKSLKNLNPRAHLFFWGYRRPQSDDDRCFESCYDEYYLFEKNFNVDSSIFEKIKAIFQLRRHLKKFIKGKHFDYVNIHYIKPEYYFILSDLKSHASKLVLTPWGSDVYLFSGFYKYCLKKIYDNADFVTGCGNRFEEDFSKMFQVQRNKLVHCEIGVKSIEYIIEHRKMIDVNEAKRLLGLSNNYIVTCGYNAAVTQRHFEMIDAIKQVRNQLPENLILMFPVTYPSNTEYIESIKQKVNECGLKAVYYEQFLELSSLFLIRQATDMFIHIQATDASSASLWDYIICEKKIINGSWLQYPELTKYGSTPFFEVDNINNLGQAIVCAYHADPIVINDNLLKDFENKQWKVVIKDWDKFFSEKANPAKV